MKKYMKDLNNVDSNNIMSPRLPKSKLYLKGLDIPYFWEDTNLLVISDVIESIIKSTYIFNDIVLASYSCVIKVLPKSDIEVV